MERKPGERMMWKLEGRSEEISGEFKAQEVANTLWAYATTMGDGGDIRGVQLAGCCKHTIDGWRRYQGSSARSMLQHGITDPQRIRHHLGTNLVNGSTNNTSSEVLRVNVYTTSSGRLSSDNSSSCSAAALRALW